MRPQKLLSRLVLLISLFLITLTLGCGNKKGEASYRPTGANNDNDKLMEPGRLTTLEPQEIACNAGRSSLPVITEIAGLFSVPIDILIAQIKQESSFQNLPLTSDNGNNSIGIGQINVAEWVACGEEPEVKRMGLSSIFTTEEFDRGEHPLNPRYNIMALASALRRSHRIFSKTLEAKRDHFGNNLVSWLAAGAAFNGGFTVWSVIYNQKETPRQLNWNLINASVLVDLIRSGKGEKGFFATHSVARHVAFLAVWLNQSNVTFCKLDDKQRTVGECGISAKARIESITARYNSSPVCFRDPKF